MNGALFVSALLMGVLGSTHCAAMCGGIPSALGGGLTPLGRGPRAAPYRLHVAMSAGRVVTYAALGALGGLLGGAAGALAPVREASLVLRALAGLALVLVGLRLAGIARGAALEKLGGSAFRALAPLTRRVLPVRGPLGALAFGGIWGLMPCGLVYSALGLATASGSAHDGALAMALFGVGTLPAMALVSALAAGFARFVRHASVRRAAGALVVVLGLVDLGAVVSMARTSGDATPTCCPEARR